VLEQELVPGQVLALVLELVVPELVVQY